MVVEYYCILEIRHCENISNNQEGQQESGLLTEGHRIKSYLLHPCLREKHKINDPTFDEQFHSEDKMKLLSILSLQYLQKFCAEGEWK